MSISRWRQPQLVWYAAYGTNTCKQHFRCIVEGGQIAGNSRTYERCADPSPPREILPLSLPCQLVFAGESTAWTGGVAFLRPDPVATAFARAYLITLEQLHHVVRQENYVPHLPPLPVGSAIANGKAIIHEQCRRYDQLLYLGHRGVYPVLTSTASQPAEVNAPSPTYLVQILQGLRELGLTHDEIVKYLRSKPGIAGHYSPAQIRKLELDSTAVRTYSLNR